MTTYEFIGGGGFGRVRLQHHQHPPLAEKLIPKMRSNSCMREAVEKECLALERLRHPNIVAYYGFYDEVNYFVIKMELCKKGGLNEVLADRHVTYNVRTTLCWCEHLFSSLNYLKKQQIIHRDIKPANVFVSNEFHLKIGDFGCVRQSCSGESMTFVGTLRYMSPEMYEHRQVSHKSDLYSTGLVIWEIVERKIVFSPFTEKHPNAPAHRQEFHHSEFFRIAREEEMTPIQEPECFDDLKSLTMQCVDYTPQARPEPEEALETVKRLQRTLSIIDFYVFEPNIHENEETLRRPLGIFGKYEEEGGFVLETQKSHLSADDLKGFTVPDAISLAPNETSSTSSATNSELTHLRNPSSGSNFELHPGDRAQEVENVAKNAKEPSFPTKNASQKAHFVIPNQGFPGDLKVPSNNVTSPKSRPNFVIPGQPSQEQFSAQVRHLTPYPSTIYQPRLDPRLELSHVRQVQNIERPSTSSHQPPNRSIEGNNKPTRSQVDQVQNRPNNHPVPSSRQDPFPQKIHQPGCPYYQKSQQSEITEENFLETQLSDDLDSEDSDSEISEEWLRHLERQFENVQMRQNSSFHQDQTTLMSYFNEDRDEHFLQYTNREQRRNPCPKPNRQFLNEKVSSLIKELFTILSDRLSEMKQIESGYTFSLTNPPDFKKFDTNEERAFLEEVTNCAQDFNASALSTLQQYQHYMVDRILFIKALHELFQTVLGGLYRVNKCQSGLQWNGFLNPQWVQKMITRCELLDRVQIAHCKGFKFQIVTDRCNRIFYVLQENVIDQCREKCILMQADFKILDAFVEEFRLLKPIPPEPITLADIYALLQTCRTLNFPL